MSIPHGIRICNPGNLRHSESFTWQGEVGVDERGFCIFDAPLNGIRALARDLRNKIRRGLDTVERILTVYAPPSENDTDSYIKSVCLSAGFAPDQVLTADQSTLERLCFAIVMHENGEQCYSAGLIAEAVQSALA